MSNADQIEYWNTRGADRWVQMQARLDDAMAPFGDAALRAAGARTGERVLDVGCGCGATTIALGAAVGASGSVLGVDISQPMLARAKERATGIANVRFEAGDAATFAFPADRDLVFSRFGVMFFRDPVLAFTNIRRALKPGGRLAFVCWRAIAENAWMNEPLRAASDLLAPPTTTDPNEPGPFAFADAARVAGILAGAGFDAPRAEKFDAPVVLSRNGVDDAVEFSMRTGPVSARSASLDETALARVRSRVRASLAPHTTDSLVALSGAAWIVTARVR